MTTRALVRVRMDIGYPFGILTGFEDALFRVPRTDASREVRRGDEAPIP